MEAKIDNTDVEGQFARPDIFDQKGVMGRMEQVLWTVWCKEL